MKLLQLLLVGLSVGIIAAEEFKRTCFYWNVFQYYPGNGKSFPEDIDTSLCTHLVYANANMTDSFTVFPTDPNDDGPGGMFERFNNLKRNSTLLTLIQIALYSAADVLRMSEMLRTSATRQQFINSSMNFARDRNFDGVALVLFYPGVGTSPPEDKERHTKLLKEMNAAFKQEANITGRPKLLIAETLTGVRTIIARAYELDKIQKHLDMMLLMTSDFYNVSLLAIQHHSPLFPINDTDEQNTVEGVLEYYRSQGVPKGKILVGMTATGRGFRLSNAANNFIGAPIVGPCSPGAYTREAGRLAYFEFCQYFNDSSATKVYRKDAKVPYLFNGTFWMGYDNQKSMTKKANYVKRKGYAGYFIWTGYDDFNGTFCNQGRFPLLRALSDAILSSVTETTE